MARSIADLRSQRVVILDGPDGYESHPPKQGNPQACSWHLALDAVGTIVSPSP
ncbi:hypothetical protein [Streptomyces sp. NPDC006510]|uniref:hypothetical protein n=1 Tax=Streptomyces sp. NPDC006510 TaxID=3155600 RepID=UPI0033A43ED7